MVGRRIARVATAIAAIVSLGLVVDGRANAQPADPSAAGDAAAGKDPKVARRWLAIGQMAVQRGAYFAARHRPDDARQQFDNAIIAYQKAIDAGDDPGLYLELALAEEKVGRLDGAVAHLRRVAQDSRVRPEVARRAAQKLDALLARVGIVTLRVTPPGASITLGGVELGQAPLAEPLVLLPGTYTLAFQASGHQPREAELQVEPGSETERAIDLEPIRIVVEPVRPLVAEDVAQVAPPPPPAPSRLPLWVGGSVAIAAAAGAGILGGLAIGEHAVFTRRTTLPADRADAQADGRLLARLADAAAITAVAAAGFTAYWYFYRYRGRLANSTEDAARDPSDSRPARHSPPISTKLDVVPWVQPQLGGMMVAGWF
jgi:PEGA domain